MDEPHFSITDGDQGNKNVALESNNDNDDTVPYDDSAAETSSQKIIKLNSLVSQYNSLKKQLKKKKSRKRIMISHSENSSGESNVSVDTAGQAFNRPLKVPKVIVKKQHSSATCMQLSSATYMQPSSADCMQQSSATCGQQSTVTCQEPDAAPSIYDRLSLLPSDDDGLLDGEGSDVEPIVHDSEIPEPPVQNPVDNVVLPYDNDASADDIDPTLASLVTNVWDRKYRYAQMKPVWDKYPTPVAISDKVVSPEMNIEISKNLQKTQNDHDESWRVYKIV